MGHTRGKSLDNNEGKERHDGTDGLGCQMKLLPKTGSRSQPHHKPGNRKIFLHVMAAIIDGWCNNKQSGIMEAMSHGERL